MQKIIQLWKVAAPILILSLFIFYSCDSGGDDDFQFCTVEELQEQFANTECIAEEFVNGCSNIECGNRGMTGIGEKEISFGGSSICNIVDCETMECELRVSGSETLLGLVSELMIDETIGLPTGNFSIENQESTFECLIVQP